MRKKKNNYKFKSRTPKFRINEEIKEYKVRLVGNEGDSKVIAVSKAIEMAKKEGLDLVEISKSKDISICRIIDYNKFLYQRKKKEKEIKTKSKSFDIKEIRFTPGTEAHDFNFKSNYVEKFLKNGSKVRVILMFRGRALVYKERGELLIYKLAERIAQFGGLESDPKMEGRRMIAILIPKK